ncbi:MAG: cytochrome c peroxidase [Gemmatimonadales bacterium]
MKNLLSRTGTRRALAAATLFVAACSDGGVTNVSTPPSIDTQRRGQFQQWGITPILPVAPQNPALVDLGRSLFFDKLLSGNRDVSCASCHQASLALGDARSLALGTHQQLTPRNAPGLFSVGLGLPYLFWDGRVSQLGFGGNSSIVTPAGPALPSGIANLLAAQAMFPVVNRVEMRGQVGDRDAFGNANELAMPGDTSFTAIWSAVMNRITAVTEYAQKLGAAYPGTDVTRLGFQYAANAIAAFEVQSFTKFNSRFDRYLARDDGALTATEKEGAMLFFTKARCSSCHNGPFLGGQQFASVAVPQIGPGSGSSVPLDIGTGDPSVHGPFQTGKFVFRVAPLRNVELTAPYMHDGAYPTLEAVVRHYNNVDSAVKSYDPTQLDPSLRSSYHGDAATINALLASLDGRLTQPIGLTVEEQKQIVAFLKSLTDPAAQSLASLVPATVPSGLPVR